MERSSCGRLAGSRMVSGGDGPIEREAIYSHIEMYQKKKETNNTNAILPICRAVVAWICLYTTQLRQHAYYLDVDTRNIDTMAMLLYSQRLTSDMP